MERAILEDNLLAWRVLITARPSDSQLRARYDEQLYVRYPLRLIATRDNRLWSSYMVLRAKAPRFLSTQMPQWREPRRVRLAAIRAIEHLSPAVAHMVIPALCEAARSDPDVEVREKAIDSLGGFGPYSDTQARDLGDRSPSEAATTWPPSVRAAMPTLCGIAKDDPDPHLRHAAIWAIASIGAPSDEALAIMFRLLIDCPDWQTREVAARWIGRATPDPVRMIPILLKGIEDPAIKSTCARALGAYGARARFVVEPLLALARTNDKAISSAASIALIGIDPEAAARVGTR
jgi:hypothetical protein